MSFRIDKQNDYTVIYIQSDKLDTNLAPSLKSELVVLNSEGVKNVIIDLSETRYCDSSGLSAILVANRLCKNSKGNLVIVNIQDSVKKLISISQLDSILIIKPTLKEGVDVLVNSKITG